MAITGIENGAAFSQMYGKLAGNGKKTDETTKGSSFVDHLNGTMKKCPYQSLATDGVINFKGVTFVCDMEHNQICLGDVSDSRKCLRIALSGGGSLVVNRDNLGELSQAISMFSPEDINRIMTAIAQDKKAQEIQMEKEEMETGVGDFLKMIDD